jgi:hypothetical protein
MPDIQIGPKSFIAINAVSHPRDSFPAAGLCLFLRTDRSCQRVATCITQMQ